MYSGKGVAELREFLAELFRSITNELVTSNDTDYDDDFEEDEVNHHTSRRDPEPEILDEDDDDDDAASEEMAPPPHRNSDLHSTPRLPERTPILPDDLTHRTFFPPVGRELMMTRETRRNPTPRAQPRAQPPNTPAWLNNVATRTRRGFGQQPIVEQSTSPTPSEAASNRSAGTNHSTGTAFFRTYADHPPTSARNGVMTPDLVYAEIGHGRGSGPGPSTILVQGHGRREPMIESSYPSASSSPTRHTMGLPPQSSIGMAATEVFSAQPRTFRLQEHDSRMKIVHDRGPVLHDTSNSYYRPEGVAGFSVVREASSPPSPTTRELHESVHSALAGTPLLEGDARGRSVKRTLRNTFAAAETFFTGRGSGGGASDGAGMAGGRDAATHGH